MSKFKKLVCNGPMQTEACGKCALCYMNGDYCSECTRGDAGCPFYAYNQMETALSALKEL